MITFKTGRQRSEFERLRELNPRLRQVLTIAAEYVSLEFGKDLMVTELYRTPEETKALYASYPAPPEWRPHENWLGADLRSWTLTDREIQKLVTFLNCFTAFKGQRQTCVYHAIKGGAAHLHAQVDRGE
jgi:hypothetical protein